MNGTELRHWRKQRRLTQADLADLLGIAPLTVLRWERGQQGIPAFLEMALRYLESQIDEPAPVA